ncbi:hypothetical protein TDB9533_02029 [Thalassocella blandensis]|nr:hypothetical protein TDB9533_02029 [Thalassocella blandensis]
MKTSHDFVQELDARRGKIISQTGGWFPGKGVYSHGYSMLEELVGEKSYFQILILNATGKLVSSELAQWMEAVYGCLSWPDPRIWCNQIGALAGVARTSAVTATAIGCLATDSRAYGVMPLMEGVGFIQEALLRHRQGMSAEDIVKDATSARGGKPFIVGYIRPIAKGDERLEVMEQVSQKLGFAEGEHLTLAYAIEKVLMEKFDEGMNINGYVSAFLSDQGFTAQEIYQMFAMLVASGVTACYLDTKQQPSEYFLPWRCDDVQYTGPEKRSVRDAR